MAISHCTGFSDQGLHASLCDGSDLEPRGRATSDVACCFMTLPDMQAPQIDAMHGECCLRHNLPSGFDARRQQNNGLDLPRGSNVRSSSIRHVMTPREPAILQSAAGVGSATRVARQPPVLEPRGQRDRTPQIEQAGPRRDPAAAHQGVHAARLAVSGLPAKCRTAPFAWTRYRSTARSQQTRDALAVLQRQCG